MSCQTKQKVIIAAGGTGGHLFPAQALARNLKIENKEVLFSGCGLSENRFFAREEFAYQSIAGATVFKKNPIHIAKGVGKIVLGIQESLKFLKKEKPQVVVGFGSYHSFPVLAAALLTRTPIILFESNSYPGKVNRLFAPFAKINAVQFLECRNKMKGRLVEVAMPLWQKKELPQGFTPGDARAVYGLKTDEKTILIFGGSQGADKINHTFLKVVEQYYREKEKVPFQVIHILGKGKDVVALEKVYQSLGATACVKEFEENMPLAYLAADLAVCRSGAATVAEITAFTIPSLFVPYPYATEDHQAKNAQTIVEAGGGMCLLEKDLTPELLKERLDQVMGSNWQESQKMKESLRLLKKEKEKTTLSQIVNDFLTR